MATTNKPQFRLPAIVRKWRDQFASEGENPRAALTHAIQRAYESGDISEATAERLDKLNQ